jgi:hypothetical protein
MIAGIWQPAAAAARIEQKHPRAQRYTVKQKSLHEGVS